VISSLAKAGLRRDADVIDRAHYEGMKAFDNAARERRATAWQELKDVFERDYPAAYARALGLPELTLAVRSALYTRSWGRVAPGALEGLRAIAEKKHPLAIVSNSDGSLTERLLALELCQVGPGPGVCVAAVVDSANVGVSKPDARIFEMALTEVGARPEEAIHVGDSLWLDVVAAQAAGLHSLHFDPYELCGTADHRDIQRLSDLVSFLD
jgi:putative hydrolase of the HAD superfamily